MSAELHIANTLRLAHEDLEAAEMLAAKENGNDAYHEQQAAEKILLALLTSESIKAERKDSHRLDVLRDPLPDANTFKRQVFPVDVSDRLRHDIPLPQGCRASSR